MHNTVFLVGRLASDPNYHEVGDGKKVSNMCLAVTRSYKNEKGEYPVDFIDVSAWGNLAEHVNNYTHKGDLVGVRGSIITEEREVDGYKKNYPIINAEEIKFISKVKNKEKEQNDELEV